LATPQLALSRPLSLEAPSKYPRRARPVNVLFLIGVAIAFGATLIGILCTGISLRYFLQPTGAVIVLGGTLGVILITTPRATLLNSMRRVTGLMSSSEADRSALVTEILHYARLARRGGIVSLESSLDKITHPFLRTGLQLAVDMGDRDQIQEVLETELRMAQQHGEADARALEVAAGYAPTLGIIGTVMGLIDVLRQFSNPQAMGSGIGAAFVSTIYGLATANLLLLPAAHRIRASVAEALEARELILEGVLGIVDSVHPSMLQMRLNAFFTKRTQHAP